MFWGIYKMSHLRIACISDVHLEYNTTPFSSLPDADVLVCAGDVGCPFTHTYKNFLQERKKKYKYMILVPGNHEYYHHSEALNLTHPRSMKKVEEKLEEICTSVGVLFLQKSSVEIEGVVFYGCTFWSDPTSSDGERWWKERHDAKHIPDLKSAKDYLRLHRQHKDWLQKSLQEASSEKVVVVTHHLPSYELVAPKFRGSSKNGYYVSNSDALVGMADLWIAGHTHCFLDQKVHGVRCVCNPVGYPWEECPHRKNLILEI